MASWHAGVAVMPFSAMAMYSTSRSVSIADCVRALWITVPSIFIIPCNKREQPTTSAGHDA